MDSEVRGGLLWRVQLRQRGLRLPAAAPRERLDLVNGHAEFTEDPPGQTLPTSHEGEQHVEVIDAPPVTSPDLLHEHAREADEVVRVGVPVGHVGSPMPRTLNEVLNHPHVDGNRAEGEEAKPGHL